MKRNSGELGLLKATVTARHMVSTIAPIKNRLVGTLSLACGSNIILFFLIVIFAPRISPTFSNAAEPILVRKIQCEFISEVGCPVKVDGLNSELDLDPFGAPIDARIYLDYRNTADQPIGAVKFRLRLTDSTGKDLGTFQGSDMTMVMPQQKGSQKWRWEKVSPDTTDLKVRVLQVRYVDGSLWESEKMKEQKQEAKKDPSS